MAFSLPSGALYVYCHSCYDINCDWEYYCRRPQVCSEFVILLNMFECHICYGSTTLVGLGLFCEVPRSHSGTPLSVGLLCTNDRPNTATSTWQLECRICPIFIINFITFKIWIFQRGVDLILNLLCCYATNVGIFLATFRLNLPFHSLRSKNLLGLSSNAAYIYNITWRPWNI